ncbi:sugar phosphate isomerase/epimerase [Serratia sp. FGI94]|uniref:sugar phosphate isomerase/epimerase family protein n=1 Tax=Serratia sp. FGI94 TaxID=671990 RepID=UPI0002A72ECD|nr:sugar phosphate isomerase/epimerase family protein [Serratia sp. FGI94]AGB80479.1 sugar phosphate isomerase/epimerase [Serratia sp. FGI94]
MKIGFNQATSMHCSTLEQDVLLCEENGFDFIEFRLDKLREYLRIHSIESLKALLAGKKIKPHALNALYIYDDMFRHQNSEKDAEIIEEFVWGCRIAKEIQAGYFIIVPPLQRDPNGGPYVGTAEKTHENCVRILRNLSDIARNYDVKLCFELVGFNRSAVRTVEQARNIINEINDSNVGLVFDVYNLYLYQGLKNFNEIKSVDVNKIFCVHINNGDFIDVSKASQENRRFCDYGVVDVNDFLKNLKEIGYDGMVSIETFRPEYWQRTPEWVIANAYQTTRNIMEENGVYSHE